MCKVVVNRSFYFFCSILIGYIFYRIYLGSLTILDCHYRTYGVIFIGAFSMTS